MEREKSRGDGRREMEGRRLKDRNWGKQERRGRKVE